MGLILLFICLGAPFYFVYRACRRWGTTALFFIAAGASFFAATGILLDHYLGPQWSWNFSHNTHAGPAVAQGILSTLLGFHFRRPKFSLRGSATIHR